MRGKRGNRLFYMLIFDMLFIAALLFSLYSINEKSSSRTMDWHDIDTKDLGLLVDVLHAAPGTVTIGFSTQPEYISKIEPDRVSIGKPLSAEQLENNVVTGDDYSWLSFGFGTNQDITINPDTSPYAFFTLEKRATSISMVTDDDEITISDCPQVDTSQADPTFKLISPSFSVQPQEASQLELIRSLIVIGLVDKGIQESHDPSVTISLHFDDEDTDHFDILYSPETPEMEKLACLNKKFLAEAVAQTISYNPSASSEAEIQFNFGLVEEFVNYRDQREDIADAIVRSIAAYYGK